MVNRSVKRSRYRKSFSSPKSRFRIGVPCRMFKPELPNLPMGTDWLQRGVAAGHPGTTNADASKKRLTARPDDRLPLPTRSGMPPMVPVPEGSKPEKDGVKYWPDCETA